MLAHLDATHLREIPIEQDEIRSSLSDGGERGLTVADNLDRELCPSENAGDGECNGSVVLDNEDGPMDHRDGAGGLGRPGKTRFGDGFGVSHQRSGVAAVPRLGWPDVHGFGGSARHGRF
jgi:hypothetical protein